MNSYQVQYSAFHSVLQGCHMWVTSCHLRNVRCWNNL